MLDFLSFFFLRRVGIATKLTDCGEARFGTRKLPTFSVQSRL